MTKSEAGKLDAKGLNKDSWVKSQASIKAAETRKKKNPNVFVEMGRMRKRIQLKQVSDE